ncbi:hypothetical protein GJ496_005080 [Pomphorhynchus laevis]|nr:hypothetical protein GJ496_005080 [Pomphorhynchus laevis]
MSERSKNSMKTNFPANAINEMNGAQIIDSARQYMLRISESITKFKTDKIRDLSPIGICLSAEHLTNQFFALAFGHYQDNNEIFVHWILFVMTKLIPAIESNNIVLITQCVQIIEIQLRNGFFGQPAATSLDVIIWSYLLAIKKYSDIISINSPVEFWLNSEVEWRSLVDDADDIQAGDNSAQSTILIDRDLLDSISEEITSSFVQKDKNVLITSALPYVNNVPHLGNLIGCLLSADVFARFARKYFKESLFISGADEYGTTTETRALEERCTPQQICDKYYKQHKTIYDWFKISCDNFGRTSNCHQTRIAQDIFTKLYDNDYILENTIEQPFCIKCERFLADRYIEGVCPLCGYDNARGDQCDKCGKLLNAMDLKEARCKICRACPINKPSRQLLLDLPKLEPIVSEWFKNVSCVGTWTSTAKSITKNWLNEGLKPRSITRDMKWGTPVPLKGFENKVFYVWFDAPIGYISITADLTADWKQWWLNPDEVELYQFMAKDNVPFHSIIFPCSLLGTRQPYTLVKHLIAIEYLNFENEKFSKSRGVGVFCDQATTMGIDPDLWRYYLISIRPETQDSNFSWDDFQLRCNGELLNNLGNFVNRAVTFCNKNFDSIVPPFIVTDEYDFDTVRKINDELNELRDAMELCHLRDGLKHVMSVSRLGNQLLQMRKPWDLLKNDATRNLAFNTIGMSINIVALLAVLCEPFIPNTAERIMHQCNMTALVPIGWPIKFTRILPEGHKINKAYPLFSRFSKDSIKLNDNATR